mgnify:CR=1 FL=1
MIGESLREALRQQGFAVDWVRDGRAADTVLASERFDAVLLDLGLPQRSGLDVLKALRARGDATPVIVLTARDALSDKVSGLDAGADDYLIKPLRARRAAGASARRGPTTGWPRELGARGGRPRARPGHRARSAVAAARCCCRRASSRCCRRCWSDRVRSCRGAQLEDRLLRLGRGAREQRHQRVRAPAAQEARRRPAAHRARRGLLRRAGEGRLSAMRSLRLRLFTLLLALAALAALAVGGGTYVSVRARPTSCSTTTCARWRCRCAIRAASLMTSAPRSPTPSSTTWCRSGRSTAWRCTAASPRAAAVLLPPHTVIGFSNVQVGGATWRVFGAAMPQHIDAGGAAACGATAAWPPRAAWRSVLPIVAAAPLVILAMWWLVGFTLAPLQRVVAAARTRDERSLDPLPATGLPDEIQPLVTAFNVCCWRAWPLAFDAQRAFVADAAHELRAPLTALRLQLGPAARRARWRAARCRAGSLRAGVDRAAHLVDQLLTLARASRPRGTAGRCRPGRLSRSRRWPTRRRWPPNDRLRSSSTRPRRARCAAIRKRCAVWCAT